jgi:hypothetical protein
MRTGGGSSGSIGEWGTSVNVGRVGSLTELLLEIQIVCEYGFTQLDKISGRQVAFLVRHHYHAAMPAKAA